MTLPNFYIAGAPKSGTSSLAQYLSEHGQVFFCSPKEPYYWCDDFPRLREFHQMHSVADYQKLFAGVGEEHLAVGEGSTNYIYSQTAIENILRETPQARFVVMLRNPVEVVYAMHGTLMFAMNEDVADFEQAWKLQDARSRGEQIPKTCLAPQFLQYRQLALFGEQMQRFMAAVPESQRQIIIFDDFAGDVRGTYLEVLQFLGVPDDGRSEFEVVNASKRHRFKAIHRLFRRPPRWLERPMLPIRRFLNSQRRGPIAFTKQLLRVEARRNPLRPEFVDELRECFRDDVAVLSELLERDLSSWVQPDTSREKPTRQRVAVDQRSN